MTKETPTKVFVVTGGSEHSWPIAVYRDKRKAQKRVCRERIAQADRAIVVIEEDLL